MSTMFRATRATQFIFRGSITSKRGNKNFYKGRGAPSMGYYAKHGKYLIDRKKYARQTFAVPSLKGFKLKPYIAVHTLKKQVSRPKMIVKVDFASKLKSERAARITKMAELKPLLGDNTKRASALREIRSLEKGLELFNIARRNQAERIRARAATRAKKIQEQQTKAARAEKKAALDQEVKKFFTVTKVENPQAEMTRALAKHHEERHARKFREFIQARAAARIAQKNIKVIKKVAVEQQAV